MDGSGGTEFGSTGPSDLSAEQEHGSFSLGSDDTDLAGFLVGFLKGGRVDAERLVQELLHLGGTDLVQLGEVKGKVGSAGSGVFHLGDTVLVLDLVGIGPPGILFQSSDTLGGDTERHGDDLHLVQGEGTGLVGADDIGSTSGLTRSQDTDEQVFLSHSLGGESQSEGDGKGETFGNGDDNQGDGDDQDRDESLTLIVGGSVGVLLELDAETDKEGEEEGRTGRSTKLGDELGKPVELHLQGSALGIGTEGCRRHETSLGQPSHHHKGVTKDAKLTHHQTTVERLGTDGDDDVFTDTLGNLGTRDQETVLLQGLAGRQRVALLDALFVRSLLDQIRFTSSTRLVTLDVVTTEEDTVDGQDFTSLDDTDVTDEDVLRDDMTCQHVGGAGGTKKHPKRARAYSPWC